MPVTSASCGCFVSGRWAIAPPCCTSSWRSSTAKPGIRRCCTTWLTARALPGPTPASWSPHLRLQTPPPSSLCPSLHGCLQSTAMRCCRGCPRWRLPSPQPLGPSWKWTPRKRFSSFLVFVLLFLRFTPVTWSVAVTWRIWCLKAHGARTFCRWWRSWPGRAQPPRSGVRTWGTRAGRSWRASWPTRKGRALRTWWRGSSDATRTPTCLLPFCCTRTGTAAPTVACVRCSGRGQTPCSAWTSGTSCAGSLLGAPPTLTSSTRPSSAGCLNAYLSTAGKIWMLWSQPSDQRWSWWASGPLQTVTSCATSARRSWLSTAGDRPAAWRRPRVSSTSSFLPSMGSKGVTRLVCRCSTPRRCGRYGRPSSPILPASRTLRESVRCSYTPRRALFWRGAFGSRSSDARGGQPPWSLSTCTSIDSSQVNPNLTSLGFCCLFLAHVLFWQLRYNFVADSFIRSQNKWTLLAFYVFLFECVWIWRYEPFTCCLSLCPERRVQLWACPSDFRHQC